MYCFNQIGLPFKISCLKFTKKTPAVQFCIVFFNICLFSLGKTTIFQRIVIEVLIIFFSFYHEFFINSHIHREKKPTQLIVFRNFFCTCDLAEKYGKKTHSLLRYFWYFCSALIRIKRHCKWTYICTWL